MTRWLAEETKRQIDPGLWDRMLKAGDLEGVLTIACIVLERRLDELHTQGVSLTWMNAIEAACQLVENQEHP